MLRDGQNIFEYASLESFLTEYIEAQKSHVRGWTIQGWSKELGLPNASAITRVLTGERTVSSRMSGAIESYFRFSALSREYYLFLVLKNKAKVDDLLSAAVERGCWPVPAANSRPEDKPLLEMKDGLIFSLVGEANLQAVTEILAPEDLEPIPTNGAALVQLNVCDYKFSSAGPYTEFYIALLCKPRDASLFDFGASFRQVICTNNTIVNLATLVWGNDYRTGIVTLKDRQAEVAIAQAKEPVARLYMAKTRAEEGKELPGAVSMWGFSAIHGSRRRFRLDIVSTGKEYAFQTERDSFHFQESSPLGTFLLQIAFVPRQWHLRENLSCRVSATIPF